MTPTNEPRTVAVCVEEEAEVQRHGRLEGKHALGGVLARWRFGRAPLAEREANGGRLPHGRLAEIERATGVSRAEIKNRIRLAMRYPTEAEVATAVARYGSWTGVRKSLKAAIDPDWLTAADAQQEEAALLAEIGEDVGEGTARPLSSEAEMLKEAVLRMKSGADDVAALLGRPLLRFNVIVAELNPRTVKQAIPKIRAAVDALNLVTAMQAEPSRLNALGPGVLRIDVDGDADDLDREARVAAAREWARQERLPLMEQLGEADDVRLLRAGNGDPVDETPGGQAGRCHNFRRSGDGP
jgi:hypothetical protein